MSNGAVYEAFRLYENNFGEFNLPPQVQVFVMEESIHLQNVCHLLLSKNSFCHPKGDEGIVTRRVTKELSPEG